MAEPQRVRCDICGEGTLLWRKTLLIVALVALLAVAPACDRSSTPEQASPAVPTATPTPVNPQALLQESGRVMAALESFHFELGHKSGSTPLDQNLSLLEASGDVAKPDRIYIEFTGWFRDFTVKSKLITVGQDSYMTNPLTDAWESVPADVSPLSYFDPQNGISNVMSQVRNPALVSSAGGVHRIRGTILSEALAPLFGVTRQGETIAVEVAIDATTLYLLEATLEGMVTPSEPPGVVRIIQLSRFNEPAAIEPPRT